jgi:hypothetical protein
VWRTNHGRGILERSHGRAIPGVTLTDKEEHGETIWGRSHVRGVMGKAACEKNQGGRKINKKSRKRTNDSERHLGGIWDGEASERHPEA